MTMQTGFVDLSFGDTGMPCWLADPGGDPRAGVVILHEIFGVNAAMRAEAERWAAKGYVTIIPDLFHQIAPGVALDYTPEGRDKAIAFWGQIDLVLARRDVEAAAAWLRASPRCNGRIAAMGFCLGGQLAVLAGNAFDAVTSFYPVRLQDHLTEIDALARPVQVHLGTDDMHIAPDVIAMLEARIGNRADGDVFVYEGAEHAFYNDFRPAGYAPEAARKARDATAAFLEQNLG